MAKQTYEDVYKKLTELGEQALTQDEKNVIKFGAPKEDVLVNSDAYDEIQVKDIKRRQKTGNVSDEEVAALEGKDIDARNEMVENIIIAGHNDVWSKHYNYKEDGGLEFDISIRMPTIIDEGSIRAKQQDYLGGTASYWPEYLSGVYYALALIRVCGVDVPDVFKDDRKIYAVTADWLFNIYQDFEEYAGRFRY